MNDIRVWFASLVAAIIGGAANGVLAVGIAPETFNFGSGLPKLGAMAGGSAILSAAMFLKQSPLPPSLLKTRVTETEVVTSTPHTKETTRVTETEHVHEAGEKLEPAVTVPKET